LVEVLRFDAAVARAITDYDSKLASALEFAAGEGEAHAYVIFFEPGGEIGPHEAGFGQIFFAARGNGWVARGDGVRVRLGEGHAACINRGEMHAKGSETGMTALMVQVRDLRPQLASESASA
jgi:quercetin dioxygenase-like cupin family protein